MSGRKVKMRGELRAPRATQTVNIPNTKYYWHLVVPIRKAHIWEKWYFKGAINE